MERKIQKIDEQINMYIRKCSADGLAFKTIRNYKLSLGLFLKWWGDRNLLELNDDTIVEYKVYLQELPSLNEVTVNNRLRDLRAFLKYSSAHGWCSDIKIKLLSIQEPDIIPLDDEQLKEIYDACMMKKTLNRFRDKTIMRLMEETGIRLTECMNIKINDMNMYDGIIKLRNTKNKKSRDAYLTPAMKKELNLYLDARLQFLSKNNLKSEYVWVSTNSRTIGQPLKARTIQEQIQEYGQIAGINIRVSPHTFRHTFARNFIVNGGDIVVLQKLLGHSSLNMVLRYVRLFGTDKQNTYLKIMENRVKNQKKQKQKNWPY